MLGSETIENVLRKDIVSGVLEPSSKLRMDDLKERYRVGYSPIREALSRLIGDGLVSFEPNRGFSVAPLSFEDLEDIAIVRIAIECKALARSIDRGDDRWEAGLVAAIYHYRQKSRTAFDDDAQMVKWENSHDELHASLISACGSRRLLDLQAKLQEQHKRYRRLIVMPDVPKSAHIEEHESLVDLALSRKTDEAVSRLESHMMITVDALKDNKIWAT